MMSAKYIRYGLLCTLPLVLVACGVEDNAEPNTVATVEQKETAVTDDTVWAEDIVVDEERVAEIQKLIAEEEARRTEEKAAYDALPQEEKDRLTAEEDAERAAREEEIQKIIAEQAALRAAESE